MTGPPPRGDREPWQCSACGTVNPWMNDTCRLCKARLADQDAPVGPAAPEAGGVPTAGLPVAGGADRGPATPVRRVAIRWVLGGAAVFLLSYALLQLLLIGIIMADGNPDLAPLQHEIDRTLGRERVGPHTPLDQLDEQQQARVRDALTENSLFVFGVFAMLLLPPFFGGLLVGRFSGSLLEAAAACGAGAFIGGAFIEGDMLIGLLFLAIMAPLGLPAALLGRFWRLRRGSGTAR